MYSRNNQTIYYNHWRSSYYAVTHVQNKKSNIQGRSPNVVKVSFHTIRNYSLRNEIAPSGAKEQKKIRSLINVGSVKKNKHQTPVLGQSRR